MDKQPLVIEQRIRDMMQYGHIALRQFPKSEKHVLAAEIRTSMLTLLRRFKRAIAAGRLTAGDCRPCIQSWCAHAAHANTWRLRCSLFNISSGANR